MTKAEEIALIKTFYNELPKDSYLAIILKGIPEYCEEQILNDWAIPPIAEIDRLSQRLISTDAQLAKDKETLEAKQLELEELEKAERNNSLHKLEIRDELEETKDRLRFKESLIKDLEAHIQKLKAELYDYMIKEKTL